MSIHFAAILDLFDVLEVVHDLNDWKRLGLALGLHYPTLSRIRNDQQNITAECKMEMLSAWLQQHDSVPEKGVPSWSGLKAALKRMGENMIADRIGFKW